MSGMITCLLAVLLMLLSRDAMDAATKAAELFARGVMPALFPMLVLGALCEPQKGERFWGAVAFAFLSGTPASSQRVRRLYDAGRVRAGELTALLAATGVMSPLFFVGTLAAWTGDAWAAWAALASHWAGALITAWLCRAATRRKSSLRDQPATPTSSAAGAPPLSRALPAALQSSMQALLAVCAAMMLFSIAAGMLRSLLTCLSPALAATSAPLLAVVHAALEIGGGCADMVRLNLPMPLVCAMCGFGGLSLWLQALLFMGDVASPAKLLGVRALHGAVSFAVCLLVMRFV